MHLSKENAKEMAEQFVTIASKNGDGPFDYSARSLVLLDNLLDGFHASGSNPNEMQGTITVASCYLGEVMRQVADGEWINGEEAGENVPEEMRFPLMLRLGTDYLVPFGKVWKRIENGSEDSIPFYFDVMVQRCGVEGVPRIASFPKSAASSNAANKGFLSRFFGGRKRP